MYDNGIDWDNKLLKFKSIKHLYRNIKNEISSIIFYKSVGIPNISLFKCDMDVW